MAECGGIPVLQREALDFVQQVASEQRLRYDQLLEPGDCLLNHNLTTFHPRTPIGDGPADVSRDEAPLVSVADLRHPFVKVAAAAFIGYTLAKLIHRRG